MKLFYRVILFSLLCHFPALAQTHRFQVSAIAAMQSIVASPPQKWFVRKDGGTRYSVNVPTGQCNGKFDASYASTGGTGVNQNCAFSDWRFLWDDKSGKVGAGAWVIAGGDWVILRDCAAGPGQVNPSSPNCRTGWDAPTGTGDNLWCYGVGSYTCYNPPIPAGTAAMHTRILGACALAGTCNPNGATNPKLYASNLTQIFGGFSLKYTLNLSGAQNVDVQGLEITSHNGQCTKGGSPAYPKSCATDQPLDDYADEGIRTDDTTENLTLQDVYVHGFNDAGFFGPIGGVTTMNRVASNFNGKVGWQFDDGSDTPDAPGSQILAHHVKMIGNGCYEEYPVKHDFSAQACYDDVSNGFGDAWSGQDTDLDTFICDDCEMAYNTKDAFIGPHTNIKNLLITNSKSYGNMGAQWKWNNTPGATTTFENNLTAGTCARFQATIPGAAHSFALASGLPGAYLSDYCRAGGNTVAINSQENSRVFFANNTFVDYYNTVFLLSCGPNNNNHSGKCGTTPFIFTNNIFQGYFLAGQLPPGLFYIDDPSITVTQNNNIEFANRTGTGETCGVNGNICSDPLLVGEPVQQAWSDQTFLDNFNFNLTSASPAIGAGATYPGILATDFSGAALSTPPPIGALMLAAVPPPPPPPPPVLITPTITWPTPSSIVSGTALSGTQLNAKASVPGTFVYAPAAGTLPAVGMDMLSVAFTPTDPTKYTNAKATVLLVVTPPAVTLKPFTMTFSVTKTCTPATSGSTVTWACK